MVQDIDELINRVAQFTQTSVNPERFSHCVRTAETAQFMCSLYNEDEKLGYLAGLAHDMCKEMSGIKQVELAEENGYTLSELEEKKKLLLHGRSASILLKRDFGVDNNDVLEAVCYHTFGSKGMCNLAKIIYIADKIEPERPHMTWDYVVALTRKSLNELTLYILKENISFLREQKKEVALSSLEFYESLGGVHAQSTTE